MTKHWAVQDAKARFSELLRDAEREPQVITYRGKPKFELRLMGSSSETSKKGGRLPRWWTSAPKVPEFKLPQRKREKMRKIDL
jgi:antitoxin (DNA-binding transcriptional repressor) of toxin-antitoxin stability system